VLEIEFESLGNIGNNLVWFPSLIDCYEFGAIVINDRRYTSNIIVLPERVIDGWWRREGHGLYVEDLEEILNHEPKRKCSSLAQAIMGL
jgi:uncharacterized protein